MTSDSILLTNIGFASYQALYLTWVNAFLTTQGFADYYKIEHKHAKRLIDDACWLYGQN